MTEDTGFVEPDPAPEDVEVTCSGGVTLPPLKNWSNPDAAADDASD